MRKVNAKQILNYLPAGEKMDAGFNAAGTTIWLVEPADAAVRIGKRPEFSNKGMYGHVLVHAGSNNTGGAAMLAAEGALHGGAGLTTALLSQENVPAFNSRLPEVMTTTRVKDADKYTCIASGPGLGKSSDAFKLLKELLQLDKPMVIDADAINMLAANTESGARQPGKKYFSKEPLVLHIPTGSIITPHIKEFDRLFGEHAGWTGRLQTALEKAVELDVVILLKNRYTFIITPAREIFINPTGCPAMAQGGMGDVLTGLIAALMAQGLDAKTAAICGAYVHGMAGERASEGKYCITATQLAQNVPAVLYQLSGQQ